MFRVWCFLSFIFMLIAFGHSQEDPLFQPAELDSTSESLQTQTLLGDTVKHGFYGAPVFKYSMLGPKNQNALLVGAQGGWILDHKYVLGLGFYSLSNVVKAPKISEIEDMVLIFNYGGFLMSYIHRQHKLLHFEASSVFGLGEANYRDQEYRAEYNKGDTFVVIEPGAQAILNVTPGFRLGVGASYRIVSRLSLLGMSNSDVSGLNVNVMFRVGYF